MREVSGRRLALAAIGAVAGIAVLYLLLPQVAGLSGTWDRLRDGDPAWLLAAAVATVGMFGGYVLQFHVTYRADLSLRESVRICLAALAASRLLSAGGAGGLVLQSWALRRAGLGLREVADRTVGFLVLQYLIYTTAVAVTGLALAGEQPFAITVVPAALAVAITAVGLSAGFIPADLAQRLGGGRLAHVPASAGAGVRLALRQLRRPDGALLGALAYWAFQIAVLWAAFHAFGQVPSVTVLVLGFFVGMLGNLLPLPGGIGGVDGGLIGAFAALGVAPGLALVCVLAFRTLTSWLPAIPGVLACLALWRNARIPTYT